MLHLFEDWKLKQTRPRTVNAVHTAVMEFRTLHGPLAVADITKAHARGYRDVLIVGADPNLSHRADRILSQGWKPTLRGSAVDKFRSWTVR